MLKTNLRHMWENSLDSGWTAEERNLLDKAVEFTSCNENNPDFIDAASHFLSNMSGADFTLISQLDPQEQFKIQILAIAYKGSEQNFLLNKLEGKPGEQVFGEKLFALPFQVQNNLPGNSDLLTFGIDSYIGATLNDENNDPIGLVVLMQRKPFLRVAFLEALLGIFSLPLEKELRKLFAVQADI
jgi:hypothetical protein